MRHINIDITRAIRGIVAVVNQFGPDHKAEGENDSVGCVYTKQDSDGFLIPVCIVGQYFANLGYLAALTYGDDYDADNFGACLVGGEVFDSLREHGVEVTEEAQVFLRATQEAQDAGLDWGTALLKGFLSTGRDLNNEGDWCVQDALKGHKVDALSVLG